MIVLYRLILWHVASKLRSLCMRDTSFLCICSLGVFQFAPARYKPFVTVVDLVV